MSSKLFLLCGGVFLSLLSYSAQARVFNFKNESIAPYFRGTGGLSVVGNNAFANAKGEETSLGDEKSAFNYSGEFGVLFHLHESFSFRIGVEAIQAQQATDLKGKNAAGDELYALESTNFIWHPNLAVEFIHKQDNRFRLFSYLGFGQGSLTVENEYEMSTLGASTYVPTYKEKLEATSMSYFGGVGLEVLLADTTTFELDLGYRLLKFTDPKHKGPITTIQGTFDKGEVGINDDGSGRNLDFSGFYMGVSFRFYIEII